VRERDQALLESVRTHRERLGSAIAFGSLGARRPLTNLTSRLIAGLVIAAIACAACVGVGFVGSILRANAAAAEEQRQQQEQQSPAPEDETPAPADETEGTAP
jgi:hypothetical protein